ncbi:MAG: peptidoglycan editing factor PgeF [Deltaproteobacteria bacterium]|nr:peptidoglycan editing factor PgeF [Deltaproteobacteria bacterium]
MIREEKDKLAFYRFPALDDPGAVHGVFTRKGGVSEGPYESLNCGTKVGDEPDRVKENRLKVCEALDARRLAVINQVHGDRVVVLEEEDLVGERVWLTGEKADAIVTRIPGLFLAIKIADCQSILFHDPVKKVVAAAHSGWKGSIGDIAGKTVSAMRKSFGSEPADIRAGVGPSLCPDCAEFVNYRAEIPESFWGYRVDKNHFDFWAMSRDQLRAAGLIEKNITVAGLCTRCGEPEFFSFRRDKVTGRCVAAIGLV